MPGCTHLLSIFWNQSHSNWGKRSETGVFEKCLPIKTLELNPQWTCTNLNFVLDPRPQRRTCFCAGQKGLRPTEQFLSHWFSDTEYTASDAKPCWKNNIFVLGTQRRGNKLAEEPTNSNYLWFVATKSLFSGCDKHFSSSTISCKTTCGEGQKGKKRTVNRIDDNVISCWTLASHVKCKKSCRRFLLSSQCRISCRFEPRNHLCLWLFCFVLNVRIFGRKTKFDWFSSLIPLPVCYELPILCEVVDTGTSRLIRMWKI